MPQSYLSLGRASAVAGGLVLIALCLASTPASAAFARRKVITIDRTRVPGTANHVDFPVLVSIAGDASLKTTANGGSVTSAQGHDILFRGEDATTCAPSASPCRLDHEIESYDGATGTLVAWVRVPTLRYSGAGADTVIYMYYGDATVTCSQQNKAGVWDASYREVFHLNEPGDHTDSTKYGFAAVGKGAVTSGAAGQIGPAVDLAGGTDGLTPARLVVSDGTLPATTSFTFEAWVYFRSYVPGGYVGFVTKGRECLNFDGSPVPQPGYCTAEPCGDWVALYKAGSDKFSLGWAWGGGALGCKVANMDDPGAVANTGQWYHVAGSFDLATKTRRLLVNGTQVMTDTGSACLEADIPHYGLLGTDNLQNDYLDGVLDEVRISFTARSNDWITTGYNNQSSPATFYAVAEQAGPYAVAATACPSRNPCAGGPGTCYLRSIGNTAVYSTGSGTCTATNGSSVVTCPGAAWRTANRGRGDRVTVDGTDYMVLAVDSETQLRLSTPFTGVTGVGNKSYAMSRQFATPQAWENCISSGGAACTYFPVANGNLVTGNRSEVGIVYKDASPYTFAVSGSYLLTIDGATTDASHTITLTADGVNRHYGVSGAGVVLDNGANTATAVRMQDQFVTVEWMEIRNGGSTGAHCLDYVPSSATNHGVIRNNIVRNCSGQSIRLAGSAVDHVADISNNIIYRGAREGIRIQSPLGTGTGSQVRVFNNTFLRNNANTAQPYTEISTAETPNPYVVLRNNVLVDDAQAPEATWNGSALCTNAAGCDWWNAASGNNITGDAAPPTGKWRSDIGPNPRGGGLAAATETSLRFVNTTAGSENLHIQMGSTAWNQGSDLTGFVLGDVDAQLRSALWDVGADELPAAAAPPVLVYSDNAASGTRPLKFSTYNGSAWATPGTTAVTGSPPFHDLPLHQKTATAGPNGVRAVVWTEDDPGTRDYLYASFWDGVNWDNGTGLPFGDAETGFTQPCWDGVLNLRCFDAAYEQQSGNLLVAYGANTVHDVRYRRYGGVWGAENATSMSGPFTGADSGRDGTFAFVRLASRPATNQIAFLGIEDQPTQTPTYGAVVAAIWDGTSGTWGSKAVLSLPVTNGQNGHLTEAADIAYVLGGTNAGEAIAVWGNGQQVYSARWSQGGGWTAGASIADLGAGNTVRWLRMAPKPQGDRMILAVEDTNRRILTLQYFATTRTWGALSGALSTTAYGNPLYNRPFDVIWDPGTGVDNVLLVYSDATRVRYRIAGDGGTFWSVEQNQDMTVRQAYWVQLVRDVTNHIHFGLQDAANALRVYLYYTGSWQIPDVQVSNNAERDANHAVEPFAIANYAPIGSTPTAVRLMSFSAIPGGGAVTLEWRTGSELDNLGFHLYRGPSADGPWTRLTSSLIPGLGSSPLGQAYSWLDSGLVNGTRYYYRLEDVDTASKSTFHGPVSAMPGAEPSPVPEPSPADGGDGGDGDASEGEGRSVSSCPSWVLAAAPDALSPVCTRHGDPDSTSLQILARDDSSATLELRTGGFWALREAAGEAQGTVRVFVPGLEFPSDPKAPALPMRRTLVEAVVGKEVELVSAEALELRTFRDLRPSAVGRAELAVGRDGTVRPARRAVAAPVLTRRYLQSAVARIAGTSFQGERKSAVVEITPVRFSSAGLVLAGRVRVRLAFEGPADGEIGTGTRGRTVPRTRALFRDVLARLHTSRRGLHAVRFEQLFPQGSRGLSTARLRLQRQGEAVAFHVEPPGPVFGPGSTLFFHADRVASSTEYSPEIAYELVRGPGVRMGTVSAPPLGATVVSSPAGFASFETNRIYQPGLLEAADLWLWDAVGSGVVKVEPFVLSGVAAGSDQTARVDVELQGGSDAAETLGDHHVRVNVNGVDAGEAYFDGKRPYRLGTTVPVSLLREGTNELAVTNVGDTGVSSLFFLDRFEVTYPQVAEARRGVFEGVWAEGGTAEVTGVSGPAVVLRDSGPPDESDVAPSWLTAFQATPGSIRFQAEAGHRYLVVSPEGLLTPRVARVALSTLADRSNQADYLVIAPRAFLGAVAPLVERRQEQGLSSRAVAFEDIVAEFGHGQPRAEAIHAFLAFAYHSWRRPSPRYVLLVGDASYDPRRFLATSRPSPLPALWTKSTYLWTASDQGLAAVNGDDPLPDLATGRLPAADPDEAEALVSKLLAWEGSGQGLSGSAVLVADAPDQGGDFEGDVEDIRASFLSDRRATTLKVGELGAAARPAILAAFDEGTSLMSYVGHGGVAVWASENVLNTWDVPSLRAQSRQPVLLTMNCLNGYFVAPNFDALPEALMKAEGRGIIAALSPSGLSLDGPAHEYHRAVTAELVSGRHERLGDAVLAAQRDYAETGLMPELLTVYQLLGDPAMRIQ